MKITLPWWAYAIAVIALLIGARVALAVHDADVRRTATLTDSLRVAQRVELKLADSLVRYSKATHVDTVTVIVHQTAYRTLRDTVLKHDTIPGAPPATPAQVKQAFAACDSTIAAQWALVTDCQAKTRILTEQIAAVSAERDLWRKQAPNLLQRHVGLVSGAAGVVGLVAGVVLGKHF